MAGIMDVLGKAATTKKTKKKVDMPTVELDKKHAPRLKAWVKHKREEKSAVSLKKKEEEVLKPAITDARREWCLENAKHHKSIKIKAGDSEIITASFQQKYSAIPTDDQERLKEIFGDDYDRSFRLVTEVSLTEETMKEVEAASKEGRATPLDKIMKAVGGPEKFLQMFSVSQSIKPTDVLDKGRVTIEDLAAKAQKAIEEGLLKPQAPSLSA